MPAFAAAGYQFEATPDLSKLETRERLSQSAMDGLFTIADKWQLPVEKVGDLLGGIPRSTLYKLKTAAGTLKQDELTRISCCSSGQPSTRQSTWYLPGDVETIAVGIGTEFEVLRAVSFASPSVSRSRYRCRTSATLSFVRFRLPEIRGFAAK